MAHFGNIGEYEKEEDFEDDVEQFD